MAKMMTFHVPQDKELLAAFGEVALVHEHLNHILRMTVKTLADLTPQEALDATKSDGSRQLRKRINKLARQRLGEGEPLLKLQALLECCKRVTEKRNELVHCVWARESDGEPQRRGSNHKWEPLPTKEGLLALAKEIQALSKTLNTARLEGFLSKALKKRKV
jgi:hypothetical protein